MSTNNELAKNQAELDKNVTYDLDTDQIKKLNDFFDVSEEDRARSARIAKLFA